MSHIGWTGMLPPKLSETANGMAGLDGAKAHRCLLRHVKLFGIATRDLYRIRYKRLREIRGENNRVLNHRTARRDGDDDVCTAGDMIKPAYVNAASIYMYRGGVTHPRPGSLMI